MKSSRIWIAAIGVCGLAAFVVATADTKSPDPAKLAEHRNLGRAFYESAGTSKQAMEHLGEAAKMNPDSARDRLNYGLALLRGGQPEAGIAELAKAQELDPSIPHTWFNLGIEYKKLGKHEEAIEQLEKMAELVPDEPVTQYNLGVLYKRVGRIADALKRFELATKLAPSLAAPQFQLFNTYRTSGEKEKAAEALARFRRLKEIQKDQVVPEDMDWSMYSEIYVPVERPQPDLTKLAKLAFEDRETQVELRQETAGLLVLDADGDGRPDLLAWDRQTAPQLLLGGEALAEKTGLDSVTGVHSAAAGDYNNDGLPDLCLLTATGPLLYRNEAGKFATAQADLPGGQFLKALWLDFDHDNDLDLFLFGKNSRLMRNQGAAGFTDRTADFPFEQGVAFDAVAIRIVPDTKGVDLIVSYLDRTGVLYRDLLAGTFQPEPLPTLTDQAGGFTAADVDKDGWLDIGYQSHGVTTLLLNREGRFVMESVVGDGPPTFVDIENRGWPEIFTAGLVYRNAGNGHYADGNFTDGLVEGTPNVAADFNGDGLPDLATVDRHNKLHRIMNRTKSPHHWVRVQLAGKKAMKLAPFSEVEVVAGAHYGKLVYQGMPLLFGLGGEKEIDTIRIMWSNGLIQNEKQKLANQALLIAEEERLMGSCPMVWTWNGREFEFVTDVLGVAPLGVKASDDTYFPPDHDEFIQIPEGALAERDGQYEVRVTQELAEVAYLDGIQLLAVDHPDGIDIYTNDRFQAPPFPEFRLFGAGSERWRPERARDGEGRDVLASLMRVDRGYPSAFQRVRAGVAEMHSLEMDFGATAAPANNAVLVLTGWVDWADGSTYFGFAQENTGGLVMPYLQVKDEAGQWRTVVESMGIPSGFPKTIVVDLAGKFLSSSREVRILTNMCLYWDEAFLAADASDPEVRLTKLHAESADLRYRGFSRISVDPEGRQPQTFYYPDPEPYVTWSQTPGLYTRFGEVAPLLDAADDRFVIMGAGDEIRLLFDAATMPPLPAGWRRSFILGFDGWEKDQDPNTAFSNSVEPLPFHGMSGYPYPPSESYPDSEAHQEYRKTWNTRPALRLLDSLAMQAPSGRTAAVVTGNRIVR